ncbi:TPA: hypothetical protein ACT5CK_002441, partial [Flavobacterium psychrophilum]
MGVDTKAILRKGVSIEQIEKAISEKYTDVEVRATSPDFMYLIFKDGKDQRRLAVSFTNSCERDNGISGIWCSLGMWGNSVEIARYLCEKFGGYLDENDCDDQEFYPINFHLYAQGAEFTQMDLFRNKVITKLGYKHLNNAIELLTEFSEVSQNG